MTTPTHKRFTMSSTEGSCASEVLFTLTDSSLLIAIKDRWGVTGAVAIPDERLFELQSWFNDLIGETFA